MATMNFSIPDDIREAFNAAFDGENKSAIVAALMKRAVEDRHSFGTEEQRKQRFQNAMKRLEELRNTGRAYTADEIRRVREEGRP